MLIKISRLILVYLCALVAFIPFLWFLCPETKGKSLEEIGVVFGDRHVHIALDSAVAVEEFTEISDKQVPISTERDYPSTEG